METVQPWYFNAIIDYWERKYGTLNATIVKALYVAASDAGGAITAVDIANRVWEKLTP